MDTLYPKRLSASPSKAANLEVWYKRGVLVGAALALGEKLALGDSLGLSDGLRDGLTVGDEVGFALGGPLGLADGLRDELTVGDEVGVMQI